MSEEVLTLGEHLLGFSKWACCQVAFYILILKPCTSAAISPHPRALFLQRAVVNAETHNWSVCGD